MKIHYQIRKYWIMYAQVWKILPKCNNFGDYVVECLLQLNIYIDVL